MSVRHYDIKELLIFTFYGDSNWWIFTLVSDLIGRPQTPLSHDRETADSKGKVKMPPLLAGCRNSHGENRRAQKGKSAE